MGPSKLHHKHFDIGIDWAVEWYKRYHSCILWWSRYRRRTKGQSEHRTKAEQILRALLNAFKCVDIDWTAFWDKQALLVLCLDQGSDGYALMWFLLFSLQLSLVFFPDMAHSCSIWPRHIVQRATMLHAQPNHYSAHLSVFYILTLDVLPTYISSCAQQEDQHS